MAFPKVLVSSSDCMECIILTACRRYADASCVLPLVTAIICFAFCLPQAAYCQLFLSLVAVQVAQVSKIPETNL